MPRSRGILRAEMGNAMAYGRLKKRLTVIHRYDREACTQAKKGFIKNVLETYVT
jgi:GrpB-like predicted nucleotidyltransferase (UPF0157 family)